MMNGRDCARHPELGVSAFMGSWPPGADVTAAR
jgi:hypothetical protein